MIRRVARALMRSTTGLHELFASLDVNKDGTLDRQEIERMVFAFEPDMSLADLAGVFSILDKDGNGVVDIQEFTSVIEAVSRDADTFTPPGSAIGYERALAQI